MSESLAHVLMLLLKNKLLKPYSPQVGGLSALTDAARKEMLHPLYKQKHWELSIFFMGTLSLWSIHVGCRTKHWELSCIGKGFAGFLCLLSHSHSLHKVFEQGLSEWANPGSSLQLNKPHTQYTIRSRYLDRTRCADNCYKVWNYIVTVQFMNTPTDTAEKSVSKAASSFPS